MFAFGIRSSAAVPKGSYRRHYITRNRHYCLRGMIERNGVYLATLGACSVLRLYDSASLCRGCCCSGLLEMRTKTLAPQIVMWMRRIWARSGDGGPVVQANFGVTLEKCCHNVRPEVHHKRGTRGAEQKAMTCCVLCVAQIMPL